MTTTKTGCMGVILLFCGICSADITRWKSPYGTTYPSGSGTLWTVYPETRDGMTGPQQLTNAFSQCNNQSLIVVKPGVYDFSDIAMKVDDFDGTVVTNHLCGHKTHRAQGGMFWGAIVGDTTAHWGDEVVFKGAGRFCDMDGDYVINAFANITFEGFDAGAVPSLPTVKNDKSSVGAVFRFVDNGDANCLSNCVLRNCRAYTAGVMYGGSLVDCVVSNNAATGGNGGAGLCMRARYCRFLNNRAKNDGGALQLETAWSNVVANVFSGNVAGNQGGAIVVPGYKIAFVPGAGGCMFSNNLAINGGGAVRVNTQVSYSFENCQFVGNVTSNSNGGAIWANGDLHAQDPVRVRTIKDCAFVGNAAYGEGKKSAYGGAIYSETANVPVADCGFTNNYAWAGGGAVRYCACTNCTFVGNRAINGGYGAAICGNDQVAKGVNPDYFAGAYDCVFRDNLRRDNTGRDAGGHSEYGGEDGYGARIVKCDTNKGGFWRCHVEDTVIHHVTNDNSNAVFYEQNFVTNCLIYGCDLSKANFGMFYRYLYDPDNSGNKYRGSVEATVVNCTFADNKLHSTYGFVANGSKGDHQIRFKNCIFSNNRKANGTLADISGYGAANGVVYANCLYGADDGTMPWVDGGANLMAADARFVGEKAEQLDAPAYSLRTSSPARGKGDTSVFGEDAHDLAGNPRLRDNKLDLGCYQCWLNPIGFMLLFR